MDRRKEHPVVQRHSGRRRAGIPWGRVSVSTRTGRALGRLWRLTRRLWRRLRMRSSGTEMPEESALVVPVAAEPALISTRDWYSSAQADGIPAHVTLLAPFLTSAEINEAVGRDLEAILSRQPPFAFQLARIGRFSEAVYLEPEPAAPFVRLTEAIVARWPDRPAYGGRFSRVVPHVTLTDGQEPSGLLDEIRRRLPMETVATEAWLMAPNRAGHWSIRRRFPLGGEVDLPAGPPAER